MKLFDSEWKVMEALWQKNDRTAKEISLCLADSIGWNKNTTYTVIKKCIDKGVIARREPGFFCRPLVTREEAQQFETAELIDRLFDGSADRLVASLLSGRKLSAQEIRRLRELVDQLE